MNQSRITRRSFLNRCGAFSPGILAAPRILSSGAFGADAPGNKLIVACIGMGGQMTVAQFGAVGDGTTDDGPALRCALMAAADASTKRGERVTLSFEPGKTYRVGPWDERWCTLPIQNAQGLTVEGNGAELLLHPKNRAFILENCNDVTIKNLAMDYNPLPFTQGDVVSVDYEAKTFVLRLHEGYADPPSMEWVRTNGQSFDHGSFFEAPPNNLFTHRWILVESVTPVPNSPRTYTVASGPATLDQIEAGKIVAGQRFAFYLPHPSREEVASRDGYDERGVWYSRLTASIQVYDSDACVFESIDHYISPRMTLFMDGCSDMAFRHFRIVRRPGTDRLISGVSDGLHGWCRRGPVVEDCTFEGTMDDSLGFQYMAHVVAEKLSSRRFRIEYTNIAWHDTRLREGDTVQAWDPVRGVLLGERRIVRMEFVSGHVRIIEFDEPLEGLHDVVNDLSGDTTRRNQASQFFLKNESPMVVRNCRFGTQLKEAVRIGYSATVENNIIENTAYGIDSVNDPVWWAGPHAQDIAYRNNRISGAWPFAIGVQVLCQQGAMAPIRGGIVIENNDITLRPRKWGSPVETGVLVSNVSGVTIRNNTITIDAGMPPDTPAIHVHNCADTAIDANTINENRPTVTRGAVLIE